MHDARDTGRTRPNTTTSPSPAIAPLDRIHRGLWGHIWVGRSPQNKLECICDDASRRLRGLGDVLLTVGLCETTPKHEIDKFHFLAETAFDVADALAAGLKAVRQAEDAAEEAEDRANAKKTKRRRKAHGRRAGA
jgi:hypothetical protein